MLLIKITNAVGLIFVLNVVALAQPMIVERERVLGQYGTVAVVNIPVLATRIGPGEVFSESVVHKGATAIRLHFTIDDRGSPGLWAVIVAGGGRQWEYSPTEDDTEFWSDEMPAGTATVTVVSTTAKPSMKLTIDRTAGTTQPTVPKSIVGPDQRLPWSKVQEPFRTIGRSIVRLRFVDDVKRRVFVCTGWLVFNNRHILTNDHCINSVPEMRSALADLDFDQDTVALRSVRFRRLLMSDARLDFSLLELEQPLDRPALSLGGAVTAKQDLAVIQHPGGEPKQLSETDCFVALVSVSGLTNDRTDFEHGCDTLGGSSGSPVLDRATLTVVGLHHLGYLPGDKPVNRAVFIADVLASIRAKFPNIAK